MANRETLLNLLGEYNTVLDGLRQETRQEDPFSTQAIARQLAYLEHRILQIETQLSILDMNVRRTFRRRMSPPDHGNLLTWLNPWHAGFRFWAYVATIAILMLTVIVFNIVSAFWMA